MFIAVRNKSETTNKHAIQLLKRVQAKEFGGIYTSDYVFDEAIIVMGVRTKKYEAMRDIGKFILSMPNLNFKFTDQKIFNLAWELHAKYDDRFLSFTDATILAWCQILKIENIITTDGHFEGILNAIVPQEEA